MGGFSLFLWFFPSAFSGLLIGIHLFRLAPSLHSAQAEPARKVFRNAEQLERELTNLIRSGITSEPFIP